MKITDQQRKKLFMLKKERGLDDEMLYSMIYTITKKEYISELTKTEGIEVINALSLHKSQKLRGNNMASNKQMNYIKGLAKDMSWNKARLNGFIKKVGGVDDISFLTKTNASKVIEGLKKLFEKGVEFYGNADEKVQRK